MLFFDAASDGIT